ncbi:H-type small acid-soluble spore protein [Lederbergia galactosidilytica]|uniref:H-type small acid-soluble spore protein n=1 Tax=Lederbergia galactosidilytica TaxID=217031 RepID=UPI0007DB42E1|nr:H-type small acid-soluble spore protein [Lederbergia galactosidilytica]MBP1914000.1 small acid-soluble spore protein H (minor) [Lederbergia galactosidilytica]
MNSQRAKEIMEASHLIQVQYHGIPVYLQKIHPEQQTATIFPLDNMEHEQIVDLEGLSE